MSSRVIYRSIRLLASLILVSNTLLFAQEPCDHAVRGRVFDRSTNEPLVAATVQIGDTGVGTTTDEAGHFHLLHVCEEEIDLVISYLGYKTMRHHHDYHHSDVEVYLSPESTILESIIVEEHANRSSMHTATVAALDRAELQLVKSESLGDILSRLPGISVAKTGQNISNPMIHGLFGNRILIINDGVRHEYQNWDANHAPEIDPSAAERIEVVKGAATVRYGPDALGGVILLHPKDVALSSNLQGGVEAIGHSNGRSAELGAHVSKGLPWMTWRVYGSGLFQGDLHAPDYNLTNTGKREVSYGTQWRFHPAPEWDLRLSYGHLDQELGILRGASNGNLEDLRNALETDVPNDTAPFSYDIAPPKQRLIHNVVKAELQYLDDRQSAHLRYSYQFNNRREFDVRRGNDLEIPNIDVDLQSHIVDADWSHPSMGRWHGKVGLQFIGKHNANQPGTNTVPFIPNYNSRSFGAFVIETLEGDDQSFEFGLRLDHFTSNIVGREPDNSVYRNQIDYTQASAVLGWQKKLSEGWAYTTHLGSAWRPPSVGELYRFGRRGTFIEYGLWRYTIEADDQIRANAILKEADRSVPAEVGYKWIHSLQFQQQALHGEINAYTHFVENYIYARPAGLSTTVRGTAPLFIYDQADAWFFGVDVAARLQHSSILKSEIRASYLWAKQVDRPGPLAGIPPPYMQYAMTYEPKLSWFDQTTIRLDLNYTWKQGRVPRILTIDELLQAKEMGIDLFQNDAADFDIADAPDAYFLADLSISAALGHLYSTVRVRNLLNTKYRHYTDRLRYFADDLGTDISLTIGYSW